MTTKERKSFYEQHRKVDKFLSTLMKMGFISKYKEKFLLRTAIVSKVDEKPKNY